MMEIERLLNFGILNLDKPSGPTSFKVSQYVKDLLGVRKTSHAGTLDPKVTGVLPVLLGRACRLFDYFTRSDKEYVGVMHLHSPTTLDELNSAIQKFVGKIVQVPPRKSAVRRAARERLVKSFEVLEFNEKSNDVLFLTRVQAGTYIRKLVHDIGEQIGGAHMTSLRRTKASIFTENDENFANLYQLERAAQKFKQGNPEELMKLIVPAEEAIQKVLPRVELSARNLKQILTGKPLRREDLNQNISALPEEFAAFCNGKFVGTYRAVDEQDFVARPEFVYN
ncbi:RNA-guided pseudouridylation complex pseudouridine synthase subunit Cbf5 [Candidatus Pacearchaeota archaeon]|nr:MAG: RNA-guided pseudouridylation complex pseudouridine synthase subunit Cbf5 [Candidatus Pacearchaeota archaeon]